jgi:imidazolonepropionase-like amidohydrolase
VALSLSYNGPAERFLVREALTQARAYLSELAEYEKAKAAGKKVNPPGRSVRPEYVELAKGVLPARLQVTKADDILAALLLVDDFGIRLVLEDAPEAWIVAEEIARRNVPVLITPRRFPDPDPMLDRQNGGTIECARILEEKGVRFAVLPPGGFGGPGYGISMMGIAGRDLMTYPMAAAFAVRGGASRRAAFRAITIVAAEISGVAERVGTIEVKKDGDLVIWDGDPLSIRGFADIVIVGGKVAYDRKKADLFGPRAKFDGR